MSEPANKLSSQICIHGVPNSSHLSPQSEPIELAAVWQMSSTEDVQAILSGEMPGFAYRRDGHPNAASLGEILRQLHHAEDIVLTAQGMSGLSAPFFALLRPGDSVVLGQPAYGKTTYLLEKEFGDWGIRTINVDACNLDEWNEAIAASPRMAVIETITNPRMSVPDIGAISALCRESGATLLVDNTFATPDLCQPLLLGADLVMESLTKFVSGHSDVMLGMVCGSKALCDRIRKTAIAFGMMSSPLDCWLTRRGLATLPLRLSQACRSAQAVADAIQKHLAVQSVDFPGLPDHPQHHLATEQFSGRFGNLLSIHLAGVDNRANEFFQAMAPEIPFCPSLGEAQTTLSHPASTSHRAFNREQLAKLGISANTIRVSIGIEDTQWLVERFLRGLEDLAGRASN
jgi:cystathionine beta-lyase/cystathionine gamma-synthase